MLRAAIDTVLNGGDLSRREVRQALDAIMTGQCRPEQIAALLAGLRTKGETGDELAGMAESMRSHAERVKTDRTPLIDTCGM